jgi:hypothetical protein
MSGRIALMVRGLPSIGIDEVVERFGKYYPEPKSDIFHTSPSFKGMNTNNSISFVNAETGSYSGGQGLTKESIRDLRKLQEDFNNYIQENPNIYTNSPTSKSRAKLYRRIGFNDLSNKEQYLDARQVRDDDMPYVKAIDTIMPFAKRFPNTASQPFFKYGDNVVASSRLNNYVITDVIQGYSPITSLEEQLDKFSQMRKPIASSFNPKRESEEWKQWNQNLQSRLGNSGNDPEYIYELLLENPERLTATRQWMRDFNFNTFGRRITPANADNILMSYDMARRDGFI